MNDTQIDPFDQFWTAYPRKFQKPKARAAWTKLDPSPALAERIIQAAEAWAAHYKAHPIDKKWIPTPANWLAGERYDEDLPDVYEDPREAAKVRAKDKAEGKPKASLSSDNSEPSDNGYQIDAPANDNDVEFRQLNCASVFAPRGRHRVIIVSSDVAKEAGETLMTLEMQHQPGDSFTIRLALEAFVRVYQDEGQRLLSDLCGAIGLEGIEDSDELHGIPFDIHIDDDGEITFFKAHDAQEA